MLRPEEPARRAARATIIVLPLRRKPPRPRWWGRLLRWLRYGQRVATGHA